MTGHALDGRWLATDADPPDQAARLRIVEDLGSNLMVEAGAGSGKTASLVDRMTRLILEEVCTADQIAAVTFTRKAAAELRERFRESLEAVAADTGAASAKAIADRALLDLDRAFVGTIHAFCARLLRQRPLDVGLDPGFRELLDSEGARLQVQAWADFLERLAADGDPRLQRLEELGIPPARLEAAFARMVENPDVDFACPFEPPLPNAKSPEDPGGTPDRSPEPRGEVGQAPQESPLERWFRHGGRPLPAPVEAARTELDELLDRASELLPDTEPAKGWDSVGKKVRALLSWRRLRDWDRPRDFFDALATLYGRNTRVTQNRWSNTSQGKAEAKALGEDLGAFAAKGAPAADLLESWWAYRYPVALEVAKAAADEFAERRRREGTLTFTDLLVLSAQLLRGNAAARHALGERWRYVLVDEFQDTDPLQAEILFLLASDPGSAGNAWASATPRPGALFVVGDPKQSIYRFRRADISLYQFVKKRFRSFGDVLRLEANFRSRDRFGVLVDGVFHGDAAFPPKGTDRQAAFAPLRPHRSGRPPAVLRTYDVADGKHAAVARDDAARIAAEISRRVRSSEQRPNDFMVLTRNRKHLATYARALEDRDLPVDVSGAGVGSEDELAAFVLLFECLADPSHRVLALAALVGPFFGVPLDQIVRYREAGGPLAINLPPWREGAPDEEGACRPIAGAERAQDALGTLHDWWTWAKKQPADVVAERLVRETGLFPLTAGGPMGALRAGTVAYVLDAVRAAALDGDASLAGAARAMERALAWEDAEAVLRPGAKAVRLMNLHRAKGLEAEVVFLAAPFGERDHTPDMHVARAEGGTARGTLVIAEPSRGWSGPQVIARPRSWEDDCAEEASFEAAEKVRLLYVAATRARSELWVARRTRSANSKKKNDSPWAPIERWMASASRIDSGEAGASGDPLAAAAELSPGRPSEPERLPPDTDLADAVEEAAGRRAEAAVPSYEAESVTDAAKSGPGAAPAASRVLRFSPPELGPGPGGEAWGKIAHEALAVAAGGARGDALRAAAKRMLAKERRPGAADRQPAELPALLSLAEAVMASPVWRRAMSSPERYAEMPFSLHEQRPAGPAVVSGTIDLVFKEAGARTWTIVDYKTDSGRDPDFPKRLRNYRAQVDRYAACWEALTDEPVGERILLFAAQGRAESW